MQGVHQIIWLEGLEDEEVAAMEDSSTAEQQLIRHWDQVQVEQIVVDDWVEFQQRL